MASSLSWLQSCKASQLKAIARLTGLNCTGTKPILISRLLQELPHSLLSGPKTRPSFQDPTQPTTIVSIDMGIRNLAYCRLTLAPSSGSSSAPLLTQWTRVAISRASASGSEKEAFDPATYSQHAYSLIATLLSPDHPSHILIERQRFRSMGGSAVQEWTLRVNMFEAMLYAVLATLAERGIWKGAVHAVPPAKVAGFWIREKDGEMTEGSWKGGGDEGHNNNATLNELDDIKPPKKQKSNPTKSQKTKTRKIQLVSEWLSQRPPKIIQLQKKSPAVQTAQAYLNKTRTSGERTKKAAPKASIASSLPTSPADLAITPPLGKLDKLDDLADCLLQGVAWIQWERNRARILEGR